MGLFDNLFLDQNTPVTINDGVDHSQEFPTVSIQKSEGGKSKAEDNIQKGKIADESVIDLFGGEKKSDDPKQSQTVNSEISDIALEIGKGPIILPGNPIPPADPSIQSIAGAGPAVSDKLDFDIGGDFSFDIGGDISDISNIENSKSDSLDINSSMVSKSGTNTEAIVSVDHVSMDPVIGTGGVVELSRDAGTIHPAPTISTKDPPLTGTDSTTSPPIPLNSADLQIGVGSVENNPVNSLMGLFSNEATLVKGESTTELSSSEKPGELGTNTVVPLVQEGEEMNISEKNLSQTSSSGLTLSNGDNERPNLLPSFSDSSSNFDLPRHSPIREKLFSYVDELRAMQLHEQNQRSHKLEQISVLEERIREIDLEANARKKFIQKEIDSLRREIEAIDSEGEDLNKMVSGLQHELHAN